MTLKQRINKDKIIAWRRYFHSHPEIAFEEFKTTEYIISELAAYPALEIHRPAKTGLIAVLCGKPGKTVALRADIDALPICEETGLSFSSEADNKMHACGHDSHAAMLLGAVDALYQLKDELCGTIKFIFQHAEERYPGGARDFVESGLLDDVDFFYASHVFTYDVAGKVASADGIVSAATDSFFIRIFGKGSHGSKPEDAIDSPLVAAELVTALNHIVSRNVSPIDSAVISIGRLHSGDIFNVIPDTAEIDGTVRSFWPEIRDLLESRIRAVVSGICAAYGAKFEIRYERGYSSTINDPKAVEILKTVVVRKLGEDAYIEMPRQMIGEDFSAYGKLAPAVFSNVLAGFSDQSKNFINHHPKFDVNEDALPIGAEIYAAFALEVLEK